MTHYLVRQEGNEQPKAIAKGTLLEVQQAMIVNAGSRLGMMYWLIEFTLDGMVIDVPGPVPGMRVVYAVVER